MFSIRRISLTLLFLESSLLLLPTIFGYVVSMVGFFQLLSGIIHRFNILALLETASVLMAVISLISFWIILLVIYNEEFTKGYKVNSACLLFASLGIMLTIVSVVLHSFSIRFLEFFMMGQLYVPTYLHMLLEIKRQTEKSHDS